MNNNPPISTLYVSDLDGTLLNEHSQVSAESAAMLNEAIGRFGAQFTCAKTLRNREKRHDGSMVDAIDLHLI